MAELGGRMWRWRIGALLVVVTVLSVASASAASANSVCRVPRLAGLTLQAARQQAAHVGCRLRLKGAPVKLARRQTVQGQYPAAGRRSSRVTLWINPLCSGPAVPGPGIVERSVTPGPTELASGFFVIAGRPVLFSTPGCNRPGRPPQAGLVEVLNEAGVIVAAGASTPGRLVEIPLPAGSYTIRGTFLGDQMMNGLNPQHRSVVIPAGATVREDFVIPFP